MALSIALGSGCYDGGTVCNAEGVRSNFSVEIRDSLSGAGLAHSALTLVTDGELSDTLLAGSAELQSGEVDRPGTYEVTITTAGYQTWQLAGVEVEEVGCHLETTHLQALLQPE
jgi:hypothetical protein